MSLHQKELTLVCIDQEFFCQIVGVEIGHHEFLNSCTKYVGKISSLHCL